MDSQDYTCKIRPSTGNNNTNTHFDDGFKIFLSLATVHKEEDKARNTVLYATKYEMSINVVHASPRRVNRQVEAFKRDPCLPASW